MFALIKLPSVESYYCGKFFLILLLISVVQFGCGNEQPPSFQDGTVSRVPDKVLKDAEALGEEKPGNGQDLAEGQGFREEDPGPFSGDETKNKNEDEERNNYEKDTPDALSSGMSGGKEVDSDSLLASKETDTGDLSKDFASGGVPGADPLAKSKGTNFNPEVMTVSDGELYSHTLNLTQAGEARVDILWIIDSSGSMQRAQEYLGANMNSFITGLASGNQNFQTAITTTDICQASYPDLNRPCPELAGYSGSSATNYRGSFVGEAGRKILRHDDEDLIERFNQYAQVGTSGSGWEHGLKATEMAVTKIKSGENEPLLREGAFLSIIIVSDEEDDGIGLSMNEGYLSGYNPTEAGATTFSYTNTELITYLDGVIGSGRYSISAITRVRDESGDICNYDHATKSDPNREEGTAYIGAAQQTGGVIQSICKENWSENLQTIGQGLEAQISQISLNAIPEPDSVQVFVNDMLYDGWSWLEGPNTIRFSQEAIPAPGSSVRVEFTSKTP